MFAKGYSDSWIARQTFNIHARYSWDLDEIAFRDYLLENQSLKEGYSRLKRKLATEFKNDREKYMDSKSIFIKNTTHIAKK